MLDTCYKPNFNVTNQYVFRTSTEQKFDTWEIVGTIVFLQFVALIGGLCGYIVLDAKVRHDTTSKIVETETKKKQS